VKALIFFQLNLLSHCDGRDIPTETQ